MDNYVGKRLDGRYEIREIIGVGGMAVVYKAHDNIDDRIVAIKILKEEFLANEEFRRRFKNESKAIAVLSHLNIVKVYDVSLGDKLQYIVMEYVEGITLKEYIEQQGVIGWKEAVHFCTQILRALQHAHDKGIVHRDIKPQNIMLLKDGTIKVTDFGIARFSRGETRTMSESAIGSVHYISPEQARGEMTDDKADIYSVGVVLYEMITGRLPFESDSAVSVAIMQLQSEPTPPREINPDIPLGLEQITLHAMEKSTKNRYQSAAEMLLDLDELKRNPAIKFDYSYFVDKEPTKFINRDALYNGMTDQKQPVQPIVIPQVGNPGKQKNDARERARAEQERRDAQRKKTIIGVSIGSAAVILIAVLAILLSSLGGSNKIEVPKFVGMNYADEIQGKYDDFEFSVNYVQSTDYAKGEVCKQTPRSGKRVSKGTKITLEVVSNGLSVSVTDVTGMTETQATRALKKQGFITITVEEEFNTDVKKGTVIRTSPEKGQTADTSEPIIVYIATDVNENEREVPDVVGLNYINDKASVEAFFTEQDLKIGNVVQEPSSQPKGYIISTDPAPGTKVDITKPENKSVNITISSGQQSLDISVTLPVDRVTRTYKLFVDHNLVKEESVLCNGSTVTSTITGSENGIPVEVTLDGTTIYEGTANFATDPAKMTNVTRHSYTIKNLF